MRARMVLLLYNLLLNDKLRVTLEFGRLILAGLTSSSVTQVYCAGSWVACSCGIRGSTHHERVSVQGTVGKYKADAILVHSSQTLNNAVIICERKPDLESTGCVDDVTLQIEERIEAFQGYQLARSTWLSLAFGEGHIQTWR